MPLSKSTTFLTRLKNLTTIERRRRRIEPPLSSFHHRSQQQSSPSPPCLPEFVGALPGKHLNLHNHILTLIRHNNGTVDSFFIQTRTVVFQASTKGSLEELDNFVKEGKVEEAVEVLGLLEKQFVAVDMSRVLLLMQACGEAKALEEAKVVHEHIVRVSSLSPLKLSTYNFIIWMYLECGSPNDAFAVFKNVREPNLTSWDTMIVGLAKNGLGKDAVDFFYRFKKVGLKPDGQMFIGVFLACSVLSDAREGMLHFESMSKDYDIVPSMEHYVSIVDMLGSTGHLDEALQFIKNMPVEPSIDIWEIMMNLCRIHGDLELGDHCAELVEQLDPARLNEESRAGLIPVDPLDLAVEKENDKSASEELIKGLKAQMKEAGYVPNLRIDQELNIDRESMEGALLAHSEGLALSHGLLSSPSRTQIRIIKNLLVCKDCHNALKIIAKIVGREISIQERRKHHLFKDGKCSCNK